MTIDRYTKAVLTIIAGALLYIGAMLSGQPASAQTMAPGSRMFIEPNRPQPVVVVGWATPERPLPVTVDHPLAVTLRGAPEQPLPVTITGVRAGGDWDELRVKVEQPLSRNPGPP